MPGTCDHNDVQGRTEQVGKALSHDLDGRQYEPHESFTSRTFQYFGHLM